MNIGLCTGGGDCPGLNASIRAVVRHAINNYGMKVFGIFESLNGLLKNPMDYQELKIEDVTDILNLGGTILGTYNRGNFFEGDGQAKVKATISAAKTLGLDAMIVIGGEGTQTMAQILADAGMPIVGIPKTIDNDLPGTDQTIGFSTCVDLVADSLLRLRSTAESHDRVMVLEVMGRDSGYIALHGGIAGGAHVILIPEIPFDYDIVCQRLLDRQRLGRNYSLIIVSEGATEKGGDARYKENPGGVKNLGGIGQLVAQKIHEQTQIETRVTVLGHLQRGGAPNATDKILATRFAIKAVDLVAEKKFGRVVVLNGGEIGEVRYQDITRYARKKLALDDNCLLTAEAIGVSLGRA